jgi:8-oxo-dGTP pyrophosphatase MutT (NUDIX family)
MRPSDPSRSVTPSHASTVVLLRPAKLPGADDGPVEVFLTRRPDSMAFAGGNFVFPGGKLDPSDYAPENLALVRGMDPERAARILGGGESPERSLGFWLAAVRELFEETGVLLCTTPEGRGPEALDADARDRLAAARDELHQRQRSLASVVSELGLRYQPASLRYLTRWITPVHYPMRFDARFFTCQIPPGQAPVACHREVAEVRWMAPAEALKAWRAREIKMRPPTVTTLMYLAQFPTCGSMFARHEDGRQRVQIP